MRQNSGNKKLIPLKGNGNPVTTNAIKTAVKSNKDDIKNFIDSEMSKFQVFQKTNTNEFNKEINIASVPKPNTKASDINKSITILKEDMKKIKGLNNQTKLNEIGKTDEVFKISQSKFKIPEMKNLNNNLTKNLNESINISNNTTSTNMRPKTPFTIKKFETAPENVLTKEIIEDLNKADNKKKNFDLEISREGLQNNISQPFARPDKIYQNPMNNNIKDDYEEEYYEEFVNDEELNRIEEDNNKKKQVEKSSSKNTEKIDSFEATKLSAKKTKKQEILERIKNLGLILEEERYDNMLEIDTSGKYYSVAENIAKGLYKNQISQTQELTSTGVETEKIEYVTRYTITDESYSTSDHIPADDKKDAGKIKNEIYSQLTNSKQNGAIEMRNNEVIYQPLSYDTYKFFVKFSSYVEKIVLNNINKYILQSPPDLQELKAFTKLDKEFILSNELIDYVNLNNLPNNEVTFNSNY